MAKWTGEYRQAGRHGRTVTQVAAEEQRRAVAEGRRASWWRDNPVKRKLVEWVERILGAARSEEGLGGAEEAYESNRTSADYLWNTVGLAAWGMVFPLLTIIVTQLVGVEQAGMFSFAFVAATLLMYLGNYGVRTFQVSDRDEEHTFLDYQMNRWATCAAMVVAGVVMCNVRGYDGAMRFMTMCVIVFKMVDALGDCYEGRLQQVDKLYLAGVSITIRSVVSLAVFALLLLVTRDLGVASAGMAVAAALTFLFVTLPLTLLETPKSDRFSMASVGRLFAQCAPAFGALFLYALVDNMPKFVMEGMLPYDNQLYFNALYFPAQAILVGVGVAYKPMLTRMADAWNDLSRRRRFDLLIVAALAAIAGVTAVVVLLMAWIGIPVMSFLYGIDFEQFRHLCYLMVVAGGITGGIDFLYQVFTVMRRQAAVLKLYVIAFVFSAAVLYMLVRVSALRGGVIGYLIVMAILLVLLLLEYGRIRVEYKRHPEDDPTYLAAKAKAGGEAVRERPSVRGDARRGRHAGADGGAGAAVRNGQRAPRPSEMRADGAWADEGPAAGGAAKGIDVPDQPVFRMPRDGR